MTTSAPEENVFELTAETLKDDKYSSKNPDPIDTNVGDLLRVRRTFLKMSQEALAQKLGITFQQVQKYENGTNRVAASRLLRIAHILAVPVSYFFEGVSIGKDNVKIKESDFTFANPKALRMARNLDQITDNDFLTAIDNLVKGMLKNDGKKQQELF